MDCCQARSIEKTEVSIAVAMLPRWGHPIRCRIGADPGLRTLSGLDQANRLVFAFAGNTTRIVEALFRIGSCSDADSCAILTPAHRTSIHLGTELWSAAACGRSSILVTRLVRLILRTMPISRDPTAAAEARGHDEAERRISRLIGGAFKRERKRTEKLLDGLRLGVRSDIGLMEERLHAKLDEIDTSLDVIARELARREGGQRSNDAV